MPTAQEIRAYLEHHGIQTALNAAVNAAIQAQAPNALEFIGDLLKAQAGGAAASDGRPATAAADSVSAAVAAIPADVSDAEKEAAAAMIQNAAATTGVSAEKLAAAAMIQNAAAKTGVSEEMIAAAALIQNSAAAAAGGTTISEKDAAAILIQNAAA